MRLSRYILIVLLFATASTAGAQTLKGLCDSVFAALKHEDFDSIKKFLPRYSDLKATYDSMDVEKQLHEIGIAQKRVELSMKRSFNNMKDEAADIDMPLDKMELEDMRHMVQTVDGKKYSNVEMDCRYRNRGATIFFTAIQLNNEWYLGEDMRITKREVEIEPDYEKIEKEAAQRKEKKKREREELKEKARRDSIKAEIKREREKEKSNAASQKAETDKVKEKKKADLEAEKKRKKEELEKKKKEKEQQKNTPKPKIQPADTLKQNDTVAPVPEPPK